MTNTYKYDVFISYARNDGLKHAEALEAKLESAGYKTWRDKRQLDPHQDFTGMIEDAIENSRVIVGCITPDVRRHDSFVRRELQFGMIDNKPIVPLLLNQSAKLPIHIVNLTYIDFTMPATQWDAPFMQLDSRLTDIKAGKWDDSDALTPPEDSFRDYCEALYKQIAKFLNQTVFSMLPAQSTDALITLKTADSPDAVLEPMMQEANALPLQFFGMAGIDLDNETPPFSDFSGAFIHYEGRVLLLGDPGSGKTTTLFAFARDAVSRRLDDPSAPLPILLPTIAWNAEQRPSLIDWVASTIPAFKNKHSEVEATLNAGKALLLLDGLDELGDRREKKQGGEVIETYDPRPLFINTILTNPNNQTVIDNQSVGEHPRVLPNHHKNKIVISCRVKDYHDIIADNAKIPLNGAITLQPLDDTQLQTYLRDLPQLWDALQNDDNLRDVARTPLLLSLFSFTFADILKHEESTDLLDDLSTLTGGALRDRLFRAYIERRYAHEQRKYTMRGEQPPFTVEQIYEILGHVAMVDASDWDADNRVLLSYFDKASIAEMEFDNFIAFMISLHLLVDGGMVKKYEWRDNSEEQSYRFIHLLLRDHLVYEYCLPRLGDKVLYPHLGSDNNPARALGKLGDVRTIDPLIAQLQDQNPYVRYPVAEALGELGDAHAVEYLIPLLQDNNTKVRYSVAEALGKLGDPQAITPLIGLLQDENADVRGAVAEALGRLRATHAVDPLIQLLQDQSEFHYFKQVKNAVREALERIGTIEALQALETDWENPSFEILVNNLQSKLNFIRASNAIELGKLGDVQAVDPLIQLLQDENIDVRKVVIEALGNLGDARAVEPLIPLLNDQSQPIFAPKVNESVREALQKIGTPEALQAIKDAEEAGWLMKKPRRLRPFRPRPPSLKPRKPNLDKDNKEDDDFDDDDFISLDDFLDGLDDD